MVGISGTQLISKCLSHWTLTCNTSSSPKSPPPPAASHNSSNCQIKGASLAPPNHCTGIAWKCFDKGTHSSSMDPVKATGMDGGSKTSSTCSRARHYYCLGAHYLANTKRHQFGTRYFANGCRPTCSRSAVEVLH